MHLEYFRKEILPLKDKLFRFARSYIRDKEVSEDIIQDVFLKIWDKRNELKSIKNIEAWCMTLTKNMVMDYFRKTQSRQVGMENYSDDDPVSVSPETLFEQAERSEIIKNIIDLLPARQKEVIILREIEQYSYQEIAEIMGIDLNLVKVTLFRARESLRKKILKSERYGL